jgi:hypothetical protein
VAADGRNNFSKNTTSGRPLSLADRCVLLLRIRARSLQVEKPSEEANKGTTIRGGHPSTPPAKVFCSDDPSASLQAMAL